MKLIEFDGLDFKVADEAFLIRPIRKLFEADKSKKKEQFWSQLSYIWFMCDPRSTYQYITDEKQRSAEIISQEGLDESLIKSKELTEAMGIYKKHTVTTSALLLEGMRKGIDNLRKFLSEVDLFATVNDKPIYQVATVTSALKQIPELAKALADAEAALAKDFATNDKAKGSVKKAIGEDV